MKLLLLIFSLICFSSFSADYTDDQIADAIWQAEGGAKAKKPYGILSIPCEGEQGCRQICLNTIRNNRKRYSDYGHKQYNDYLSFLASRYAPVNCENDNGTNQYWLKNVKYFLAKGAK